MGKIFAIEEFSTFDGPGVRMSVFFKGCPLSCNWCHNPEGQKFDTEYMRSLSGCTECKACIHAGGGRLTADSIAACPKGLVRAVGEEISPEALAKKILKNADIINSMSGGVTFSGGEPICQSEFLLQTLALLQGKIHRAVQTCGFCDANAFQKVTQNCELILFDLKIADGKLHQTYCGTENGIILQNFHFAGQCGIPLIVRIPLIPTVTDTEENLTGIAEILQKENVRYAELMPYNKMAGSKYAGLMRAFSPMYDEDIPCCPRTEIFESYGIKVKVI